VFSELKRIVTSLMDLSAIPQLRAALIALLEELPGQETCLGASE